MPQRLDLEQKIRDMEETIRVQRMENDQLAERAEDTLLLGVIAEQISGAEEIRQVIDSGLERISVLKDIPFCACCSWSGNRAVIIRSYLSFTDENVRNRAIVLPERTVRKLAAGDCLLSGDECRQAGISVELKAGSFVPRSAICIPFKSRFTEANIFIFADNRFEDRFPGVAGMLHRVTEMMTARVDNISLFLELQALNRKLDRKIEERTRDLKESENRFRQFFENEPEYCYIIASDGYFLDVNQAALKVLAYRKEELVGKPLQTIYAPESLPKMREILEKWKAAGKLSDVELVILSKTGERRTVLLSADTVKDAEGRVVHSFSVQRDITERKQAEDALRRERLLLSQITETSPVGIAMVNHEGLVTFANRQAELQLGLSKTEITQRAYNAPEWRITDFDGGPFPDEQLPFRQVMTSRLPVSDVRHAIEWPDGRRVYLSINGAPLLNEDGAIEGVVFSLEDITERRRAEEEIRKLNAELEQRVKERTAELEAKKNEMEKMNRLFVGRELRMIELKKQISALEKRISGEATA